ncbi:unnamed protein product [Camellia sinensis]
MNIVTSSEKALYQRGIDETVSIGHASLQLSESDGRLNREGDRERTGERGGEAPKMALPTRWVVIHWLRQLFLRNYSML